MQVSSPVPPAARQRQDAVWTVSLLSRIEDTVQSNRPKLARGRRPWVTPVVVDLPRLTDLTLSTPIPGSGNTGTGSTVTP
jgi:hypothetical protein